MQIRAYNVKPHTIQNPLAIMKGKRPLDAYIKWLTTFQVLAALDAAKRSQGTNQNCNTLTENLMIACGIWSKIQNKKQYDIAALAWEALSKAADRPTDLLDLTTGEYKTIQKAIVAYIRQLSVVEVGVYAYATINAQTSLHGREHNEKGRNH